MCKTVRDFNRRKLFKISRKKVKKKEEMCHHKKQT